MKSTILLFVGSGLALGWQPVASAQSPSPTPSAPAAQSPAGAETKDLVATLKSAGQFNKFCQLLSAADMLPTLQGAGPFTVFAPTDEAFAKLPGSVLDDFLKPENKSRLKQLLSYHIANGKYNAAELGQKESLMTLSGEELEIDQGAETNRVQIDDAEIKTADIAASNGVLHAIDRVLQP